MLRSRSLSRAVVPLALRRPSTAPALARLARANQQGVGRSEQFDALDGERRRLLYRSKQRGWLEMDIMLGNWAASNLQRLEKGELKQYAELLEMENPDLYKWLTGQEPVPDEVRALVPTEPTEPSPTSAHPSPPPPAPPPPMATALTLPGRCKMICCGSFVRSSRSR